MLEKPADMFDRDAEWSGLAAFVTDARPGATLGIVSGRRRQGKTYLLDAVCQASGGFYFGATEATEAESLRRIGMALTEYLRPATPFRPTDWHEVVDVLLTLGAQRPVPVVLDEFPYLAKATPELPSIIQQAYGPLREQRTRSSTRLLLCGSAMSFMGRLLSGGAPLRGRAGLEIVVHSLDYRLAAQFWGITDPNLAVRVNAIVGGTPAYRREFARDDVPSGLNDFDDWVTRTVLNPASPLFREARYLLAEEPDTRDGALYHSVLAAVAEGNAARGGIANFLRRPSSDIAHPLNVLEDVGLLAREPDAFRNGRTTYRIAEPLVTFYSAVMRPVWGQLERPGAAARVWRASQTRYVSTVLGPRFEQLCREFALADPVGLLGDDLPARVGGGVVNDPNRRTSHEVDVAVVGIADGGKPPLLSIGEAKWGEIMGTSHLDRLRRIKELIANGGRYDTSRTRLVCYSGAGFAPELLEASTAGHVTLVGLDDLYRENGSPRYRSSER
jgi:AAA+ ATPase superfamily predicted ATPase